MNSKNFFAIFCCFLCFQTAFSLNAQIMKEVIKKEYIKEDTLKYRSKKSTFSLKLYDCLLLALEKNLTISIQKTEPLIDQWRIVGERSIFDPQYAFNFSYNDSKIPTSSITRLSTGLGSLETESIDFSNSVSGLIPTGTQYSFFYDSYKYEGTSTFFQSEYDSKMGISLTQPLLRNFGIDTIYARIRIANLNKDISELTLKETVIDVLSQVQDAYWDLLLAIKELEVFKESLELAQTLLQDNIKRVEVGALPPIEITQAEAGVASREENVIIGQQVVLNYTNRLMALLYDDPADMMTLEIVPVDSPIVAEIDLSFKDSLKIAYDMRTDYLRVKKRINSEKLNIRYFLNQQLPEVNFVGEYNMQGISGNYGNALDWMNAEDTREWILGVEVTIPFGNRLRRSEYQESLLKLKKLEYEMRVIELNLVKEIDDAIGNIRTNMKRIVATRASTKLADEALQAEIKKMESGASTSHNVLEFQEDLSRAKFKEVQAVIDYRKSLFELSRVEGDILEELNISVDE